MQTKSFSRNNATMRPGSILVVGKKDEEIVVGMVLSRHGYAIYNDY